MENLEVSKKKTVLFFSLLYGSAEIIYNLLTMYVGMGEVKGFGIISFLILILSIVYGLKDYKKKNNGYLKFGKGFNIGFLIVLIGGLINIVFFYLLYSYIDPSKFQEIVEVMQKVAMTSGLNSEQFSMMATFIDNYLTPLLISVVSFFWLLFVAVIIPLIIAAIIKKEPENPFIEEAGEKNVVTE